jgi:hypothetical protein
MIIKKALDKQPDILYYGIIGSASSYSIIFYICMEGLPFTGDYS